MLEVLQVAEAEAAEVEAAAKGDPRSTKRCGAPQRGRLRTPACVCVCLCGVVSVFAYSSTLCGMSMGMSTGRAGTCCWIAWSSACGWPGPG